MARGKTPNMPDSMPRPGKKWVSMGYVLLHNFTCAPLLGADFQYNRNTSYFIYLCFVRCLFAYSLLPGRWESEE